MEKIEKIAEEIKNRPLLVEYLKPAKRGYVCPKCGNGSGKDGTGAVISEDGTRLLCGKCQRGLTNIDILAAHLGLGTSGKDYVEVVKYGGKILGIEMEKPKFSMPQAKKEKSEAELAQERKENELIQEDISMAQKNIEKLPVEGRRGLSLSTLKYFGCGYIAEWKPPKSRVSGTYAKETPRLIVPSGTHYLARLIVPLSRYDEKTREYIKEKQHAGTKYPFNFSSISSEKINIVVEGEIDAMSIWQATSGNFPIIATSGAAGFENFVELVRKKYESVEKKPKFLILYDSDETGRKNAPKLQKALKNAGYSSVYEFLTEEETKKDANDILRGEGEEKLSEKISSIVDSAVEKLVKQEKEYEKEIIGEEANEYFAESYRGYLESRKEFAERKTGFANLDEEMGAILPGVYIVGGLAALGKTTFCWQILEQMARQGEHCIYVSYEMSAGELYSKMVARSVYLLERKKGAVEKDKILTATQINRNKFYNHKKNFEEAVEKLSREQINLRVWELEDTEIEKLFERIRKYKELKGTPPVVVIDYLQILAGNAENVKVAIDEVLRKLKNFQRETNTTFIVISSLNRANYSTEISFESFKESGGIEYSADVVWGLQLYIPDGKRNYENIEAAKKEIPRQIQLKCLKNRHGRNYDVGFFYYPNADYFEEMEEYGAYTDYRLNDEGRMVEVNKQKKKKSY